MNKSFLKIVLLALLCCLSTSLARADDATVAAIVESAQKKLRAAKSLGDYAAVRKELLPAAVKYPQSALVQFWLAETSRWATRYASTQPLEILGAVSSDPALLDPDEAIRCYSLAISINPKMARAYFGRGSFYLERSAPGDDFLAFDDFIRAAGFEKDYAPAYLGRALVSRRIGRPPNDAFGLYHKAITLGIPESGEDETYEKITAPRLKAAAYAGRGEMVLLLHNGDEVGMTKALLDFNAALAAYPDALDARLARARVLAQKNQLDAALTDLNYLLQRVPDNASALAARAEIYRAQNQNEKARSEMRRALELDGSLSTQATAPVYVGLAASLEAQKRGDKWLSFGDLDEALAEYSKALELDKENAAALAGRATVKMRRKDLAGAQADLDEALKLQPDSVKNLTARGQVLARQGKFDLALADLGKATQLAPGDVAAWEQTGIVQQAQGKYSDAEKSYNTALGFAALNLGSAQETSTSLLPSRRLIVIAAQGKNLNWDEEAKKISVPLRGAAFQILGIEYRKQPDSAALSKLHDAFANLLNANGP